MDTERIESAGAFERSPVSADAPAPSTRSDKAPADLTGPGAQLSSATPDGPTKIRRGATGGDRAATPNRTGMPDRLKAGIEALSGYSLDHVSVHYNSALPSKIGAMAYTQGTNIHVAPGQEQHLPHEAWHVVQQALGRVRPTTQIGGVSVNDSDALEADAEAMGSKAASGGGEPESEPRVLPNLPDDVAQMRKFADGEAKPWLIGKIKTLQPLPAEVTVDQLQTWLKADAGLNADFQANLTSLKALRAEALVTAAREAATLGLTKQRTISDKMRGHILRGEIKGTVVTGGHWRTGCEANGLTVAVVAQGAGGFYTGTVTAKGGAPKASSFFPDDWTEDEVIDAIEYATQPIKTKPILVIETPKGKGTPLFQNNDSIFPNL